ncbi:MAG TPA: amidohydrolase family protein [Chloroflexota bacterium]
MQATQAYVVVDGDGHVREDDAALRARLPARWSHRRQLMPIDGFDRDLGGRLGKNKVDAEMHLADMDVEGIGVSVLYPTAGLFLGDLREPEYSVAYCHAYNDWLADYCRIDSKRLKGVALLPLQDVAASCTELQRAVRELGMVGAMFPTFFRLGPQSPGDKTYDPFYATAQDLAVPVAFHASGSVARANNSFSNFLEVHIHSHVPEQMAMLTFTLLEGVLERFPRLTIGFMEAGCGWVPFWLEHIDEEWEKRRAEAPLQAKPSEYALSGRCYFGVEPEERMIPIAAEMLGAGQLLYASDYPHWDSGWPDTVKTLRERRDISESLKQKILATNAQTFYHLGK